MFELHRNYRHSTVFELSTATYLCFKVHLPYNPIVHNLIVHLPHNSVVHLPYNLVVHLPHNPEVHLPHILVVH